MEKDIVVVTHPEKMKGEALANFKGAIGQWFSDRGRDVDILFLLPDIDIKIIKGRE